MIKRSKTIIGWSILNKAFGHRYDRYDTTCIHRQARVDCNTDFRTIILRIDANLSSYLEIKIARGNYRYEFFFVIAIAPLSVLLFRARRYHGEIIDTLIVVNNGDIDNRQIEKRVQKMERYDNDRERAW